MNSFGGAGSVGVPESRVSFWYDGYQVGFEKGIEEGLKRAARHAEVEATIADILRQGLTVDGTAKAIRERFGL